MGSNLERDRIVGELLGELHVVRTEAHADEVRQLVWQAWHFHEDMAVAAALRTGIDNMNEGNLEVAEFRFQAAARMDPSYAEAWNKLATVQYLSGDYASSLSSIRRALFLEPRHFGALSGRGLVLARLFRFREAFEAFQEAGSVAPGRGARTRLVEVLGARATAWGWLTEALRPGAAALASLAPHTGAVVVTLSVLLGAVFGTAGTDPGGAQDPLAPSGWSTRTETQIERVLRPQEFVRTTDVFRVTRIGAPLEELDRAVGALDSNHDRAEVSARLLDELAAAESPRRARVLVQLVWRSWLFHENPVAARAVSDGSELMADGELQAAEWRFLNAVHFDPGYAEAWNKLATVHYLMGQQEASLAEIQQTLELEPFHFGALSGRGLVLLQLERFGEAAQAFREAQEAFPAAEGLGEDIAFAEARQQEAEAEGLEAALGLP